MADDFNFSLLHRKGSIKTYPPKNKAFNKFDIQKVKEDIQGKIQGEIQEEVLEEYSEFKEKREPLTTKNAVRLLLHGALKNDVCRYCLHVTKPLSELDQIMQIATKGTLFKVTIRDMVASFHPIQVRDDRNFPNKICKECLDSTIKAYLFTQQCEQAERALHNCFDDIYEKVEKLDPIEIIKKRGRRKVNPNHNIIYAEHENVINYAQPIINLVNTSSETLTPENAVMELECLKCSQVLPNIESLLNHEKRHPTTMWYNCRMCGKAFPKRRQIKKHFQSHLSDKPKTTTDNSFVCKECDSVFEKHTEYLQHIEKHKFKIVMEHLLERKMDKLCSICLTKGRGMVEMEKMICLHGGSPNLSGDQSLYSILASTLPDPKSYKYRELIIPREATIVKIVKKTGTQLAEGIKNKSDGKINIPMPVIAKKSEYEDDSYKFFFALPETVENKTKIVVKEINTVNKLDVYTEETEVLRNIKDNSEMETNQKPMKADHNIFNNPQNVKEVPRNIKEISDILNNQTPICHDESGHDVTFNDAQNTKEVLRNINDNSDFETNQKSKEADDNVAQNYNSDNTKNNPNTTTKLCKICWIFNKPSCKTCIVKNKAKAENAGNSISDHKIEFLNTGKINAENQNTCKYCWLFKNVSICDHCKKSTSNNNRQSTSKNIQLNVVAEANDTDIKNYEHKNYFNNKSDEIINDITTSNNSELGSHIKENIEDNIQSKSVKGTNDITWHCPMCLTTNEDNIEKFHCCDPKRFKSEVKFKFDSQRLDFLSHNNKIKSEQIKQNNEKCEAPRKIDSESLTIQNPTTSSKIIENSNQVEPMDIEVVNVTLHDSNQINSKTDTIVVKNTASIENDKKVPNIFKFGTLNPVGKHFKGNEITEQPSDTCLNTNDKVIQYEDMDIIDDVNIIDNSHINKPGNYKNILTPQYNLDIVNHSHNIIPTNENALMPQYKFNIGNSPVNDKKIRRTKRKLSRAS